MLEDVLAVRSLVLVMSVDPGFAGQSFHPAALERIRRLRRALGERSLEHVEIAVDGGIHADTIARVARAGATYAVAGSAIFNSHASVAESLSALRAAVDMGDERAAPVR